MEMTLGQQYNIGEKPTVILYTSNINRHAASPDKDKTKCKYYVISTIIYSDPYNNKE